jgi:iron complex outermembrane recepter protein
MKLKRSKLRDAIVISLAAGAVAFTAAGAASAQESEATEPQQASSLDTITVTGTRIRSQTLTSSSPVVEIGAEEFKFAGATIVEDLVNQYPQLAPVFDNFQNNPSQGYSTIDLRGLGANRTLTLVNGRRIPKGSAETADISIIPTALIKRVDILTGGASAVYGSDAIAGVVNFLLDDEFEGVSVDVGYSAYQHKNRNKYIQGLMDDTGFDYPTGNSGFDGISKNVDLAIGGRFGEGGHALAWATWRKNDALFQGQRDYSSCALNATGLACGGSGTADPANFYIYAYDGSFAGYAHPEGGTWLDDGGAPFFLYNYAPINYYQRPDTRFTTGVNIKYEINEHFTPYIEAMFVNRRAPIQIAPSGAFFTDVTVPCDQPQIGTLCSDLGIAGTDDVLIYVAKRNVEGGPRYADQEFTNYSITSGISGAINADWSYDASFTYGRSSFAAQNYNDFLTDRIRQALLGCPAGSFDGCLPYEVWTGTVTPEQAQALQGVGTVNTVTDMMVLNGYVSGDLGFGLPSADGQTIGLVAGYEWRKERYSFVTDTNSQSGNFAGSGGTSPPLDAGFRVEELFLESNVPLVANAGALSNLDLQLGYRYTTYDITDDAHTYKLGLGASFLDNRYKLRMGYNRAIRGPGLNELYAAPSLGLWGGEDPCAGASPEYTEAQCALTGVPAGRYGSVPLNAASQYNATFGGNANLKPEEADTWTLGFAANPIDNLTFSVDYFDIKLKDQIQALNGRVTIDLCVATADPQFCDQIHRNATNGALTRDDNAFVDAFNENSGEIHLQGVDLFGSYAFQVGPGRLTTSLAGTYVLKKEYDPKPGFEVSAVYDCAGIISPECQTPKWRHIANIRYGFDRYSVGLRWRYMGELSYENPRNGNALVGDRLTCAVGTPVPPLANGQPGPPCIGSGKIAAYNYLDLSASADFGPASWTIGVNNIADKEPPMVGGGLVLNGNSIGGYDQAGRYIFTSVSFKF